MKRLKFHRAIVALTMMLIGWLPSLAHDFKVDGVFYNKINSSTVEVTYKGYSYDTYSDEYSGNVVIPSSVNYNGVTYSVTSIGDYAFYECYSLTSVVIGNSVTSIGFEAFYYCESLTSIEIPNSVTSIGSSAFYLCSSLTGIEIPNSITSIGDLAFYRCSSLTSIQIPNSVTSIGYAAFANCSSLTSIQIPNSVTSIENKAFYSCSGLTNIVVDAGNSKYDSRNGCNAIIETASNTLIAGCQNTIIPNSVTSIGDYAFYGCSGLTSIQIPNSVTSIGWDAFRECSSLTSIQIPNSVKSIGNGAFSYCSSFTSIEIGNSVTNIGDLAFYRCSSLTSIVVDSGNSIYDSRNDCNAIIETASNTLIVGCQNTIIPNSVTSIGDLAFYYCRSLTSIQIPNSVKSIGNYAFWGCSSLTSVEIPNSVTSIGDEAFYRCESLTSIEIPNSVTSIGDRAFEECSSLTSIQIPNSVTRIGERAFYECSSLTSVVIGNSVTSIGEKVFSNCSSLTSIQIPNSVKSIGYAAFYYCRSLKSVVIGNSVTRIGGSAFNWCDSLTKITCLATNPPTIGSDTFFGNSATLYVPAGCISAYQSDYYWKKFYNIKEIPTLSTSIALNKTTATLKATETLTLVATVLPENATDKSVTWKSSNEAVAIVDANGLVTAIAVGEVTITATTTDGSNLSASCKVTVVPTLATSITLDKTEYEIVEKSDFQLTATILPESTTNKGVVWSSSDMWIASVDENGLVRAYSVGEAVITATTIDGSNLSASCKVTVVSSLAQSITLDKTEVSLKATETATLVATVLPETTSNKGVEWTSSDESVAIISKKGVVTAIAVGEAVITATTIDGTDLSATCKVTVIPTLATSITLDKTEYEIVEKSDFQLTATILPESTTNKGVVWSSSDMWVASVDENGLVRAYSVGEAVITATTIDGSNLSASCKVTVVSSLAQSITLDKTEVSLKATETATLVATVLPETTSNKGVEWTSSDESVAIVSKKGVVTAIAVGEAVITATTIDGSNLSASCKVTVLPTLAESITLDKTEISLEATETATLIATVLPEATFNKGVEWSSTDKAVAVVDENGVVTAVAVGEATITATTVDDSNLSASCKVTVVPTLAVSIELDQTEASVEEKSEFQLTATILPKHTTNKEVAWSSSKKVIATVDETGLVFVKSVGEVVITVTTTDGTNLSAACHINVYSGIDGVNGDVIVATVGDNIVVKNAKLGSVVNVYASNGALVASEEATDGSVVVEAPVKGVYVVKVGKQTVKVII